MVASRCTNEELAELEDLLSAEHDGQSLAAFIASEFPRQPPPPHLRSLLDLFERARHRPIKACVSLPPGHAKTVTILRAIAWWLKRSPADTCAYATYSDSKAWSESRRAREWAQQAGVIMRADTQNVAEWRTPQGGGLLSVGAKGGLTGRRVSGVLVVDDPYKDREEVNSTAIRERIWEWFTEVAHTRLEGGSVIVVHTRWSEDDLIGRLESQGWEVVNLPAIAEEDDALGRAPGAPLWPELYSLATLAEARALMGEWSFAALYQGHPRPRGSSVFGAAHYYDATTFDPRGCVIMIGGDPAASTSTRADHSVALALAVQGYGVRAVGHVLDVRRAQIEVPDYVDLVRRMSVQWWNAPLAIESVGGFKAVPQSLRRIDPDLRLVEVRMGADKFTRAQPVAAAWNSGRLLVPTAAPWLKVFLAELQRFTGVSDAEDDQVDALAHAWNAIADNEVPLFGPISI